MTPRAEEIARMEEGAEAASILAMISMDRRPDSVRDLFVSICSTEKMWSPRSLIASDSFAKLPDLFVLPCSRPESLLVSLSMLFRIYCFQFSWVRL